MVSIYKPLGTNARLTPVTAATLPVAGVSGRLQYVSDSTPHLRIDTGTEWLSLSASTFDIIANDVCPGLLYGTGLSQADRLANRVAIQTGVTYIKSLSSLGLATGKPRLVFGPGTIEYEVDPAITTVKHDGALPHWVIGIYVDTSMVFAGSGVNTTAFHLFPDQVTFDNCFGLVVDAYNVAHNVTIENLSFYGPQTPWQNGFNTTQDDNLLNNVAIYYQGHSGNATRSEFRLQNVRIDGGRLNTGVSASAGNTRVILRDVDLKALGIPFSSFGGSDATREIHAENVTTHDWGTSVHNYDQDLDVESSGTAPYGAGWYIHPHIWTTAINCKFYNGVRYAFYFNGSPSTVATHPHELTNCVVENTVDGFLQSSKSTKTKIRGGDYSSGRISPSTAGGAFVNNDISVIGARITGLGFNMQAAAKDNEFISNEFTLIDDTDINGVITIGSTNGFTVVANNIIRAEFSGTSSEGVNISRQRFVSVNGTTNTVAITGNLSAPSRTVSGGKYSSFLTNGAGHNITVLGNRISGCRFGLYSGDLSTLSFDYNYFDCLTAALQGINGTDNLLTGGMNNYFVGGDPATQTGTTKQQLQARKAIAAAANFADSFLLDLNYDTFPVNSAGTINNLYFYGSTSYANNFHRGFITIIPTVSNVILGSGGNIVNGATLTANVPVLVYHDPATGKFTKV